MTLLFVVPWTIRGTLNTGQFVPVTDTVYLHFWQSTRTDSDALGGDSLEAAALADTGYDADPELTISDIRNRDFFRAGLQNIAAAPGVWIGHVLGDAAGSYLQPYGTQFLMPRGNPSAREEMTSLLRGEISPGAFLALPGIFRRLLIYLWHYWALLLGLAGFSPDTVAAQGQYLPIGGVDRLQHGLPDRLADRATVSVPAGLRLHRTGGLRICALMGCHQWKHAPATPPLASAEAD